MPYLMFAVICLIWGVSFLLMKKAGLALGPVTIAAWRVTFGAAVLALAWTVKRGGWPIKKKHLPTCLLVTLLGQVIPYSILPWFIHRYGESGFMGMLIAWVPLLTILVQIPILKKLPTGRELFGVLGGLACVAVVFWDGLLRDFDILHLLAASSVPLCYAVANSFVKRDLTEIPPMFLTLFNLALSTLLLWPVALLVMGEQVKDETHLPLAMGMVAILGLVGTGIAISMFNKLVQDHGPLFAGMVGYLIPAGALVWGWWDGEIITPRQLIGLFGALAMVALVQWGAAKKSLPVKPQPE